VIKFSGHLIILVGFCLLAMAPSSYQKTEKTSLKITFENTINGRKIHLNDSVYANPFGEKYNITKLKYYVSNISLLGALGSGNQENCFLIDEKVSTTIELEVMPGKYSGLQFVLGVDSVKNFSGAQAGALDPLNDMFWTWNSGYVVFKLEGRSESSAADLNRIEYHIGGYKGKDNVSSAIRINAGSEIDIKADQVNELKVSADINKFWNGHYLVRIKEIPVCINAGELAKNISTNFPLVFNIKLQL
jgi:hypothetical protein